MRHHLSRYNPSTYRYEDVPCLCMWCAPAGYKVSSLLDTRSFEAVVSWGMALSLGERKDFAKALGQ